MKKDKKMKPATSSVDHVIQNVNFVVCSTYCLLLIWKYIIIIILTMNPSCGQSCSRCHHCCWKIKIRLWNPWYWLCSSFWFFSHALGFQGCLRKDSVTRSSPGWRTCTLTTSRWWWWTMSWASLMWITDGPEGREMSRQCTGSYMELTL